ncbi:esterase [Auriculariales sp. MPI-PUGE-AT-0066]|nr:esterase [Auriculariales sp. MPI-PUGE-AT-0066]
MTVHILPSGATLTEIGSAGPKPLPACIVFPGGGYEYLAPQEAEPVAEWLGSIGFRGFILRYRFTPHLHPAPLEDAQAAIRIVRENATTWGVLTDAVGIIGFSAGGHLAATTSTHWANRVERPDFTILIYPVVTMKDPLTHAGSRSFLLGPNPDPALVDDLSNETRVTKDTPPTFIVHGVDDATVSVGNSFAYATALLQCRVPFEIHCPQHMPHEVGLGDPGTPMDWRHAAAVWLTNITNQG